MTNNALKNLESLGDGLGPLTPGSTFTVASTQRAVLCPLPRQLLNADSSLGGACCAPHLTDEETEAEQSHHLPRHAADR